MKKIIILFVFIALSCNSNISRKGSFTGKFIKLELGEENTFCFVETSGEKPNEKDTIKVKDWELESCKNDLKMIYENKNNNIGKIFKVTWIEAIDNGETMEYPKGYKHLVIKKLKRIE
jgi:hypothetical protein